MNTYKATGMEYDDGLIMIAIIAAKNESDAKKLVKHWSNIWNIELIVEQSTCNKSMLILQGCRPC